MLVKDGVVEKMLVEPDEPGDPFKVSDAEMMLSYQYQGHEAQISLFVYKGGLSVLCPCQDNATRAWPGL